MTALTVVVVLAGLVIATVLSRRTPPLPAVPAVDVGQGDDVLIVVPARNEEDVLPALLDDLARQTLAPRRVVVVDDGSEDGTAAVAARPGVELRRAPATPPGWNPKSWALHHGLAEATEPIVVFLDADVRLAPDAVASVLSALARHRGLVSVAPRHDVAGAVEALSLPFNLVALMGAGAGWSARTPAAHAAFGPCIAMHRADHAAIGGHQADRGDLLDDIALAARARRHGVPVSLFRGGPLVRYRMYRQGLGQIIDGWSKNIAAGATRTPLPAAVGVGAWITALLVPLVVVGSAGSAADLVAGAVAWLAVGAHTAALARLVGRFPILAGLAAPLLAVAFVAIVARSAVLLAVGRPVRWKGRRLLPPTREAGRA